MSLNNPNPFFNRLKTRDSKLFLVKEEGNYKAYSRSCPSNVRRQPVILTDSEKDKIDRNHPGSYDKAIKYGSSPDKQYWYICPRYWSLKHNTSLTEEEVKSGKYGKIIPLNAKKVPDDANIYEFTDNKIHKDKNDKYITHYPGFLKADNHPNGLCVPCCFRAWDSPEQVKRREQCIKGVEEEGKEEKEEEDEEEKGERKEEEKEEEELKTKEPIKSVKTKRFKIKILEEPEQIDKSKKVTKKLKQLDYYIKGPEKFPLEKERWGYLPLSLQLFLNTDNTKCYISKINTNLKPNHTCILRQGVEYNKNQSFLACIADAFKDISNTPKSLSIKEFKKILINSLSIDIFVSLQNGSLIKVFENDKKDVIISDIYKKSNLYKNINKSDKNSIFLLKTIITSYELFIEYLNDDNIIIDYKYLWDLICKPNKKLFPKGINLVILELLNNDITDNVSLICPSNHYSSEFFDINKRTLILMKQEQLYEPIYTFEDKVDKWEINRTFSLNNEDLLPNLREILYVIKSTYTKKCLPMMSMPTIYKFKRNLLLTNMLMILETINYNSEKQIMNYQGKIIGLIVKNRNNIKCFVPVYPSSPVNNLDILMMDDESLWNDFQTTVDFLINLSKDSNNSIPCLPKIKVLEDGLIVGLLTETNQFISINEPEQNTTYMDMETINNNNYIIPDVTTQTSKNFDIDRVKYIKRIKLENQFYTIFRSIIRILLGQFKFRKLREIIELTIQNKYLLYNKKLDRIKEVLKDITNEYILFEKYTDDDIMNIDNISNCNVSKECNAAYCATSNGNICKLIISKTNLINNSNNENIYFIKIADELIRYNRIKNFIFQPKAFLSFIDVKYNLREDEIILLQSLITQEYFSDLVPDIKNRYANISNSYDIINPLDKQPYSNVIDLDSSLINESILDINKEIQSQTQLKKSIEVEKKTEENLSIKSLPSLELEEFESKKSESKSKEKESKESKPIEEKEVQQLEEKQSQPLEEKEVQQLEKQVEPSQVKSIQKKKKFKIRIIEEPLEEAKSQEEKLVQPPQEEKLVQLQEEAKPQEEKIIEPSQSKAVQKQKKIKIRIIEGPEEKELPSEMMLEVSNLCEKDDKDKVSGKLKKILPTKTTETIFNNDTTLCTFDIIKVLIKDHTGEDITKSKIREEILEEYKKMPEYTFQILEILLKQSKKLAREVQKGHMRLEDFILSNSYYITNLDIWVIANRYNIPIIFLSKTFLLENKKEILVAHSDGSEKYYFIKSPITNLDKLPSYVLYSYNGSNKISLSRIKPDGQLYIREHQNDLSLREYIESFSSAIVKKPKKIKKRFVIINEENLVSE